MKLLGLIVCSVLATAYGENGPRIINGERTTTKDVPYIAHLLSFNRHQFVCGASIIDKNWALTAAHCITSGHYALLVNKRQTKVQKIIRIEKAILHPDYQKQFKILGTEPNDIALLKLRDNSIIQYSNIIHPAPTDVGDFEGQECTTAGWGANYLQFRPGKFDRKMFERLTKQYRTQLKAKGYLHQTIGLIQKEQCAQVYKVFDEATQLCLHNNETGGCKGDSGGPLVCDGYLAGVTSMVDRTCSPRFPTMFTKVSAYYDWISSETGITFEPEEAIPQEETPEEAPQEEIPEEAPQEEIPEEASEETPEEALTVESPGVEEIILHALETLSLLQDLEEIPEEASEETPEEALTVESPDVEEIILHALETMLQDLEE